MRNSYCLVEAAQREEDARGGARAQERLWLSRQEASRSLPSVSHLICVMHQRVNEVLRPKSDELDPAATQHALCQMQCVTLC